MPWTWWECWRLWDDEVECVDDDDDVEAKCVGKIVRDGGPGQTVRVVLFPDIRPTCLVASVLPPLRTLPCKFGNAKNTKNKKDTKYQTLELLVLLLPFFQVVRDVQILKSNNWKDTNMQNNLQRNLDNVWKFSNTKRRHRKKNHPRHYSNFPL